MRKLISLLMTVPLMQATAAELHVFAAASLTDALKEIGAQFEKQSGIHPVFNFAASSLLERQIAEGAPADVFLSADEDKMDQLQERNLIEPSSRRDLLGNSLVVVAPADSQLTMKNASDLGGTDFHKIALADPQAVPAGIYARKYLEQVHLADQLREKIVPTENVRAALAAVEAGNADAAFVYKTDATISKKVRVIFSVPPGKAPPIRYPVAIVRETKQREAASVFVKYLESPAARDVFTRCGFLVQP
jgi:molybdate transport system substrate-binding protein